MKHGSSLILIVSIFYGCIHEKKAAPVDREKIEMEVVNDILPLLIPEQLPCMVVPVEGETKEDYEDRLNQFNAEIDSTGRKVEIIGRLTRIDTTYAEAYKRIWSPALVEILLNAERNDRFIDSTRIDEIDQVNVVIVDGPRKTIGGFSDCQTLGRVSISRVGFNNDFSKAVFTYGIDDGSCKEDEGGIVAAEKQIDKWVKIN